jgi:hypothetical protein
MGIEIEIEIDIWIVHRPKIDLGDGMKKNDLRLAIELAIQSIIVSQDNLKDFKVVD